MASQRHDKALREFKHILQDLVFLIRKSTGADTTYLVWVNKQRQQFVWEADSTIAPNVMFADRIQFDQFYLDDFKDIDAPVALTVGEQVPKEKLRHYFDFIPITQSIVIPFINKGETVALTVIETEKALDLDTIMESILAYNNAIANVLNTYLELVDLDEEQKEWEHYELMLNQFDYKMHRVELIQHSLKCMNEIVPTGGVSFIAKGSDTWNVILNEHGQSNPLAMGLMLEEKSLCYQALEKGEPVFSMHFNQTPKRISTRELLTYGASFAIPILVNSSRQGVIMVYDDDPLVFKEATKHKLANLVRVAALNIQSILKNGDKDIFVNDYGAFIPDVWELAIQNELELNREKHTWFGLISPANLSSLRTRFRLEELHMLQKDIISLINPSHHNQNGFIGYHSDYIYSFMIQSEDPNAIENWLQSIDARTRDGFQLSNGTQIELAFNTGYTLLNSSQYQDAHQVLTSAKNGLNEAVKDENQDHVLV